MIQNTQVPCIICIRTFLSTNANISMLIFRYAPECLQATLSTFYSSQDTRNNPFHKAKGSPVFHQGKAKRRAEEEEERIRGKQEES